MVVSSLLGVLFNRFAFNRFLFKCLHQLHGGSLWGTRDCMLITRLYHMEPITRSQDGKKIGGLKKKKDRTSQMEFKAFETAGIKEDILVFFP